MYYIHNRFISLLMYPNIIFIVGSQQLMSIVIMIHKNCVVLKNFMKIFKGYHDNKKINSIISVFIHPRKKLKFNIVSRELLLTYIKTPFNI